MKVIKLPVENYFFDFRFSIDDEVFTGTLKYNVYAERWALSVRNDSNEYLFKQLFVSTGVDYAKVYAGFPEDSQMFFIGDESSSDLSKLQMVIEDAV